jgi:hypothetical protein
MTKYTPEQVCQLLETAQILNIPLYNETTLEDIRVLIKHKQLAETQEPSN